MRPNPIEIDWPADTAMTGWRDHFIALAELIKHEIVDAQRAGATKEDLAPLKKRFTRAVKSAGLKIG